MELTAYRDVGNWLLHPFPDECTFIYTLYFNFSRIEVEQQMHWVGVLRRERQQPAACVHMGPLSSVFRYAQALNTKE